MISQEQVTHKLSVNYGEIEFAANGEYTFNFTSFLTVDESEILKNEISDNQLTNIALLNQYRFEANLRSIFVADNVEIELITIEGDFDDTDLTAIVKISPYSPHDDKSDFAAEIERILAQHYAIELESIDWIGDNQAKLNLQDWHENVSHAIGLIREYVNRENLISSFDVDNHLLVGKLYFDKFAAKLSTANRRVIMTDFYFGGSDFDMHIEIKFDSLNE